MTDDLHVVADLRRQLVALPDRPAPRRAPALAVAALAAVAAAAGRARVDIVLVLGVPGG